MSRPKQWGATKFSLYFYTLLEQNDIPTRDAVKSDKVLPRYVREMNLVLTAVEDMGRTKDELADIMVALARDWEEEGLNDRYCRGQGISVYDLRYILGNLFSLLSDTYEYPDEPIDPSLSKEVS